MDHCCFFYLFLVGKTLMVQWLMSRINVWRSFGRTIWKKVGISFVWTCNDFKVSTMAISMFWWWSGHLWSSTSEFISFSHFFPEIKLECWWLSESVSNLNQVHIGSDPCLNCTRHTPAEMKSLGPFGSTSRMDAARSWAPFRQLPVGGVRGGCCWAT